MKVINKQDLKEMLRINRNVLENDIEPITMFLYLNKKFYLEIFSYKKLIKYYIRGIEKDLEEKNLVLLKNFTIKKVKNLVDEIFTNEIKEKCKIQSIDLWLDESVRINIL